MKIEYVRNFLKCLLIINLFIYIYNNNVLKYYVCIYYSIEFLGLMHTYCNNLCVC